MRMFENASEPEFKSKGLMTSNNTIVTTKANAVTINVLLVKFSFLLYPNATIISQREYHT